MIGVTAVPPDDYLDFEDKNKENDDDTEPKTSRGLNKSKKSSEPPRTNHNNAKKNKDKNNDPVVNTPKPIKHIAQKKTHPMKTRHANAKSDRS